jgi:Mg2+/citrate symporter
MTDPILNFFMTILPSVIVGVVCFYFLSSYMKNEERRRRFITVRESQGKTLPTRMAAYERMTLFLERIKPNNLVVRTPAGSMTVAQYEQFLVTAIDQEFEHNIAQQIYVSEEAWNIIRAAKNTTIQQIRQVALSDKIKSAEDLRKAIVNELLDKRAPSAAALSFLRAEVRDLF